MIFILLFFVLSTTQAVNEEKPYSVYVKQSGSDTNTGTEIGQEKKSLKSAYDLLGEDEVCKINVVKDADAFSFGQITLNKMQGISIEGIDCDGSENTIIDINMNGTIQESETKVIECNGIVEFKYLAFRILSYLFDIRNNEKVESGFLIKSTGSLTVSNCKFLRPVFGTGDAYISLIDASGFNLILDTVECGDGNEEIIFRRSPVNSNGTKTVIFTNMTLKQVTSKIGSVVEIDSGGNNEKIDLTLNRSTFSECKANGYAVFYVSSVGSEGTFTVGDGGVTTFTSCSCRSGQSGAMNLFLAGVHSASQLKWPTDGRNLVFENCKVGEGESQKNTALYLFLNYKNLLNDVALEMKESFAENYTQENNLENIIFEIYRDMRYDFTSLYFDPTPQKPDNMTRAFVKNGGKGNGISVESAIKSLKRAYDFLEKSGKCFIDIVKTSDPMKAENISFSINSGITIEGVNDKGKGNTEVSINCDVSVSSILFSCKKIVEFKYLAFQFSSTEKNWDSLISAGLGSISLKISTCRFARIGSQTQEGMNSNADGNSPLTSSLVSVTSGSVEMDTVKCTDETSFVTFSSSPFSFSGASEVSLRGMDISKVNVESGAAVSIRDESDSSSKVSIEGLNVQDVKSEKGAAAGLDITLSSEESRVAIGRSSKCSFKSCSAPEGKSGAIFIDIPKATSNLKLPSANNLKIDSSNTAGSKTTSLFIIAPDFEEFCKQEDAFEFANDFNESTVGWIEGAKDAETEPEDVYEKYVKVRQEKLKEQNKKKKAGIIVAIVVPIVVVVAAVVVIVIIIVIVRKKRSRNDENGNKEQEMNN
ncbi:uncharacterized protein MONOS_6551 [Monocercomonoides exilis]|uniref:uncharacterized protein n=1 Tax=Monocercomonoides exilis TaxID=2049356 RepID=UPI00355A2514|nr:hypothetical protein MONOS_6551 [Monocercomonoides exilis]|eukprot:MONOS_6551.1-p1 / transcript=MONOS_6551.1 / gene=MONOS_6551 / organism=Monocercomonoides_exilis_PA203 / gene_product=unspecified product / transcript_product=unspecified product / location=Mono_scaffold00208:11689-14142(-) / protein_length=818 / sequence_SO=supercontig / SO=protein_coding / is_pseudo=false